MYIKYTIFFEFLFSDKKNHDKIKDLSNFQKFIYNFTYTYLNKYVYPKKYVFYV